jgi:hypothetical protein
MPFWVPAATRALAWMPLLAGWERIAAAVAQRYREVLPEDEFDVEYEAGTFNLTVSSIGAHRPGAVMIGLAHMVLRLPLPRSLRLRTFFENEAQGLQDFVSEITGKPWPAPGATPHVRVTVDEVRVWYGDANEHGAALSWRPITRAELGI